MTVKGPYEKNGGSMSPLAEFRPWQGSGGRAFWLMAEGCLGGEGRERPCLIRMYLMRKRERLWGWWQFQEHRRENRLQWDRWWGIWCGYAQESGFGSRQGSHLAQAYKAVSWGESRCGRLGKLPVLATTEVKQRVSHWGSMVSVCGSGIALPLPLPPGSQLSPSGPAFSTWPLPHSHLQGSYSQLALCTSSLAWEEPVICG